MAFTQADIKAMEQALVRGERRVRKHDRELELDLATMAKVLEQAKKDVAQAGGTLRRHIRIHTGKGF